MKRLALLTGLAWILIAYGWAFWGVGDALFGGAR
jgi:hypothetical protein